MLQSNGRRAYLALISVLLFGPFSAPAMGQGSTVASCSADSALVQAGGATLSFQIEIADTPEERAKGLMFRQEVPEGTGMLFIYERPQPVSFWMRNTLVPLDMLFLDETGVIRHIHKNARPLDETGVPGAVIGDPDPDRLMVLELAGGESDRLGLEEGQSLAHPSIDQKYAAFPCR